MLFLSSLLFSLVAATLQSTRYVRTAPESNKYGPVLPEHSKVNNLHMTKYDSKLGAQVNYKNLNRQVIHEEDDLNPLRTKEEVFQDWTRTLKRIAELKKEKEILEKLNSTPLKFTEEYEKARKAHSKYYKSRDEKKKKEYKLIYDEAKKDYEELKMAYRKLFQEHTIRIKEYDDEIYDLEGIAETTKQLYDMFTSDIINI